MSNLKNVLLAIGFFAIALSANASLLIEPHLGYNVSGGQASFSNAKYDYSGAQYGARLGAQFLGVMGGFDYTHSTYTLDKTAVGSSKVSADQKQDDLGIFVGYNAPILLRAWFGYYFSSKRTQTETGSFGANGDWYKGTGTELGVGFTPLPLVSLNIMYRMFSYDKQNSGTLSTKYEPKEIVLGVSVPFTLL